MLELISCYVNSKLFAIKPNKMSKNLKAHNIIYDNITSKYLFRETAILFSRFGRGSRIRSVLDKIRRNLEVKKKTSKNVLQNRGINEIFSYTLFASKAGQAIPPVPVNMHLQNRGINEIFCYNIFASKTGQAKPHVPANMHLDLELPLNAVQLHQLVSNIVTNTLIGVICFAIAWAMIMVLIHWKKEADDNSSRPFWIYDEFSSFKYPAWYNKYSKKEGKKLVFYGSKIDGVYYRIQQLTLEQRKFLVLAIGSMIVHMIFVLIILYIGLAKVTGNFNNEWLDMDWFGQIILYPLISISWAIVRFIRVPEYVTPQELEISRFLNMRIYNDISNDDQVHMLINDLSKSWSIQNKIKDTWIVYIHIWMILWFAFVSMAIVLNYFETLPSLIWLVPHLSIWVFMAMHKSIVWWKLNNFAINLPLWFWFIKWHLFTTAWAAVGVADLYL